MPLRFVVHPGGMHDNSPTFSTLGTVAARRPLSPEGTAEPYSHELTTHAMVIGFNLSVGRGAH